MNQEPGEQRGVGAGLQAEEQLGVFGGVGAARIDHDHARAARLLVGHHALEQHRMAPRCVGADQHQQIGFVEILVAAGHGVGAEAAAMSRHGGRHAQPRIGIDIAGAEESLHQLVGDVIVLGQHLTGKIEGNGLGAVARDDVLQAMRDMVERVAPIHALHPALAATDHRMQQATFQRERLAERRALGAQPAEIRGVLGIARDRGTAIAVGRREHAAADAAIRTGGFGSAEFWIDRGHDIGLTPPWPASRARGRTSGPCGWRRWSCGRGSSRDTRAHLMVSPISTAPVSLPSEMTSFL